PRGVAGAGGSGGYPARPRHGVVDPHRRPVRGVPGGHPQALYLRGHSRGIGNRALLLAVPDARLPAPAGADPARPPGGQAGGWAPATRSQLDCLPECHTDCLFAGPGEACGLSGVAVLRSIYLSIISRGLIIAPNAQSRFGRLLAGSLTLTFFVYGCVNMGMVS